MPALEPAPAEDDVPAADIIGDAGRAEDDDAVGSIRAVGATKSFISV